MASTPENISQVYKAWCFSREITTKGRLPNDDHWVDFNASNNSLNAGSFVYGKIISYLDSQYEMEGRVKTT